MYKTRRKKYVFLISISIIVILIVGATLAYLSYNTSTRTNNFTFNHAGLSAELYEPLFDGDDWDGVYDIDPSGDKLTDVPMTLGKDEAISMSPGTTVQQNPFVVNNGNLSEWVSLKISFMSGNRLLTYEEMKLVNEVMEFGGWGDGWTKVGDNEYTSEVVYSYDSVLAAGEYTVPLFRTMMVKNSVTRGQFAQMPAEFKIVFSGFGAQEGIATTAAGWKNYMFDVDPLNVAYYKEREEFLFTINTTQTDTGLDGSDKTFSIPLSGCNGGQNYNWNIDWGDGYIETVTETGSQTSDGIFHQYDDAGVYQIKITPAGSTDAWFRAFGFWSGPDGANVQANRNKVLSPDSKLTPLMYFTQAQIAVGGVASGKGYDICRYLFYQCQGYNFTMGANFGFSRGWDAITTVGGSFCYSMFSGCSGAAFSMNDIFNLPQEITTVGYAFCYSMFNRCSGTMFAMNSVFNLPQGITTVEGSFCYNMFSGANFVAADGINDVFKFPTLAAGEVNKTDVFKNTFNLNTSTVVSNRTTESIINGSGTPSSNKNCFRPTNKWADTVLPNW